VAATKRQRRLAAAGGALGVVVALTLVAARYQRGSHVDHVTAEEVQQVCPYLTGDSAFAQDQFLGAGWLCAVTPLGAQGSPQQRRVFVDVLAYSPKRLDGTLPVALTRVNGRYVRAEVPRDSTHYEPDIHRLFPRALWRIALTGEGVDQGPASLDLMRQMAQAGLVRSH